ncbi:hypothetical protein [Streptomyces albospinus]|nr:hypothetical protein [Streptomyces albospinus]
MCARTDGATMSAKKDSYANIRAGRDPATRSNRYPETRTRPPGFTPTAPDSPSDRTTYLHEPSEAAGAGA